MEQAEHIAVSVIIPIFNAERHMEECLDSCFGQTLTNIEIICINDGSTDKTEEILERYAQGHNNMCVLSQENQGAGAARNLGMKYAKGEFIAFMDSDDYYPSKEVLQKLYYTAVSKKVLVCGGTALFLRCGKQPLCFKEDKKIYYKDYQESKGFTRFIYNRIFLQENNLVFPPYRYNEDPPFFTRTMSLVQEFQVTGEYVYAIRNTDKIIRYDDEAILLGTLKGCKDILEIAKANHYEKLQVEMIKAVETFLPFVYKAVYRGNLGVRKLYNELVAEMDDDILLKYEKDIAKHQLMTDEQIHKMFKEVLDRENKLMRKIKEYTRVIIYGAGKMGRLLCDYIIKRGYNGDILFMVSFTEGNNTACGKREESISDCVKYKEEALVLIANQYSVDEMEENAHKHLFKNVEKIPCEELMLFGADLKEDNYITIF